MNLKDFQKFVEKGPPGKKSKNILTPAGSWLANATKSMGYSMLDITGQLAPNTIEHLRSAKENATAIKDAVVSTTDSSSRQIREAIEKNDYIQIAKEGVRNALEDLKSGKFYNQERRQKFISDEMGGDFDFDDFGMDNWETEGEFSADDDGASVRVKSAGKDGVHVSNISMRNHIGEGSPIVEATNYQTATIAKGTEALANTSITNTQIVANILGRLGEEQGRSFAALTSTVADVSSEINTKLTELTGLSATYYNDSISIFKEIRSSIEAIKISSSAGTATQAAKNPRELRDALSVIGSGGTLNFSAYRDMVKKNAKSWAESDMIASTIMGFFSQKETLRDMMQQPLKFIIDSAVHTLIPETMKSAAKNLDQMIGEFITTGLTQLGSMQSSANPIASALGQILGIRQEMRTSINKGNYEKGRVAFDGITHRTINEVIPTYLRQMVSLLSGREEMGYDYERGIFRSVRSMEKDYLDTIKRNKLNPFTDDIQQFNDMLKTKFTAKSTNEIKSLEKDFENAIIKLVNNGGIRNYRKTYSRNGTVTDELADLTGLSGERLEILRGFLEGRSRTGGGNAANARMFGSSIQEARSAVSRTNMQMETNPYESNAQYVKNGLEAHTNAHLRIPRLEERGSKIRQISGVTAGGIDKYGKSTADYARNILKVLMSGIVVYPGGFMGGEKPPEKGKRSKRKAKQASPRLVNPYDKKRKELSDEEIKLSRVERIPTRENARYAKEVKEGNIDISSLKDISSEQVALVSAESIQEEQQKEFGSKKGKPTLLQRIRDGNGTIAKWAGYLDDKVQKGSDVATKGIRAVDDFLYELLFGDGRTKGMRYLFDKVWDGMKYGFGKFGSFLDERVLKPIDSILFGEDGIFTKFKESQFYKDISSKFKNASDYFGERIFGKKTEGPNGVTYEGGLISSTINGFGDIGRATKEAIFGGKDSSGKLLPLDQDTSIVGGIKRTFNNISKSIADQLGIKPKNDNEDVTFRELIKTSIQSTMERFKSRASGFLDNIFGKASEDNHTFVQNGRDLLNNFKTEMKGKGGYLAAGGILGAIGVPILSSSMGLLGSLFLPGGPIGGALIGAGLSFVTQSETLKTKLFGEKDENGDRLGGIIHKDLQKILKDNKIGIATGAGLGLISSWGLLPGMFLPGGPIGGALIGAGLSMVTKSKAFGDFLYGPDGTKDDPTGGVLERFKTIFGKNKDVKGVALDAALGSGVGLIGSFFLPGGPIGGALIGAGLSIVSNTERFRRIVFGDEKFDKDGNSLGRSGGLIGKFTTFIQKKAVHPFMRKFEEMQVNLTYFIKDKMLRPISIALAPLTHKLIDVGENLGTIVKGTFDKIGEKFEQIVLKPVGEAVDKYIFNPIRKLSSKLWNGFTSILGAIIAAPFALIGETGKGIYKSDMRRGERAAVEKVKKERNATTLDQLRSGKIFRALGTYAKGTFNAYRPKTRADGRYSRDGAGWYASKTNNPILNDKRIHEENISERDRRLKEIEAKYENKGFANKQNVRKARRNVSERIAVQAEDSARIQEKTLSETSQIVENTASISTSTGAIRSWIDHLSARLGWAGTPESLKIKGSTEPTTTRQKDRMQKLKNATIGKNGRILPKKSTDDDSDSNKTSSALSASSDKIQLSTRTSVSTRNRLDGRDTFDFVRSIYREVDGNLNGVGYNVNKIYGLLLKHFHEKDDDIKGGDNKKFRGPLRRFADFIGTPVRVVKDIIFSPFRILGRVGSGIAHKLGSIGSGIATTIETVIGGLVGGVSDILSAFASIPGQLLKITSAAIRGAVKVIGTGLEVAASTFTTAIQVGGETLVIGIRATGNAIQNAAAGIGKAAGNIVQGLSSMAAGIMKLGGGLLEGAGKLTNGILGGIGDIGRGLGKGIGAGLSGIGSLIERGTDSVGRSFGLAKSVYVIGGKLDTVEEVKKVKNVITVQNVKSHPSGGNGGFGGFGPIGGFGLPKPIQKVFVEGGFLDGIRRQEDKQNPHKSKINAFVDSLKKKDQETNRGSAESIREIWKKEKVEEQAIQSAEEEKKQTTMLSNIARSTEEHKNIFDSIFGPKGKIAMLLMLGIPFVINFFKNHSLQDIVDSIVGAIPSAIRSALSGIESLLSSIRGKKMGQGENGTGYAIDENGSISIDENGRPISNASSGDRTATQTLKDIVFPLKTRINAKTGEASTGRSYDDFSESIVHHGARIGTKIGIKGVRTGAKAMRGVNAAGRYFASASKYGKSLGFIQRTTPGVGSKVAHEFATKMTGGKGKVLGTIMNKVGSTKVGQAASKVVAAGNVVLGQFIGIAKKGLNMLSAKLTEFLTKHGAKRGAEAGIVALLKKIAGTLSETTLGKFSAKIATAVANFVAGLSPATIANVAFGGLAFLNANPAQVFNVDKSAVDWKMQLISRTMKALLGTSFGMIFDVLFEIANSVLGYDLGKEICVCLYNGISSEEEKANLNAAQQEFDAEWRAYQDSEYDAYCEHELKLGNQPMSREQFEAAGLLTTKNEFNRNKNKTVLGHMMSGITGAWNGMKTVGSKAGSSIAAIAQNTGNFLADIPTGIKNVVAGTSRNIKNLMGVDSFKDVLTHPGSAIRQGTMNLVKGGANFIGKGVDTASRAILGDQIVDSVTGFIKPAFDKISSIFQGAIDIQRVAEASWSNTMQSAVTTGKISGAEKVTLNEDDPLLVYKSFAASASKLMAIPPALVACLGYHVTSSFKKLFGWIPSFGKKIEQIHTDNVQAMETGTLSIKNHGEGTEGSLLSVIDMMDQGFLVFAGAAKKMIGAVTGSIKSIVGNISQFGSTVVGIHGRHVQEMENGELTLGNYGDGLSGRIFTVIDMIDQAGLVVFGAFKKVTKSIHDTVSGAIQGIGNFLKKVVEIPTRHWNQATNGESLTVANHGDGPIAMVLTTMDTISATLMTPVGGIVCSLKAISNKIGETLGSIGTEVSSATKEAFNIKDGNLDITKNYFHTMKDVKGKNPISGILSNIVFNTIRTLMLPIYALQNGLSGLFGKMGDMINGALDKLGFGSAVKVEPSSSSGGNGGYGGDNTYVSQNDPALANQPYRLSNGEYDTFQNRGCGPAAMTMVANKLGHKAKPLDVAKDATDGGYSTEVGTRTEFFGNEASKFGMRSSKMPATEGNLRANLGGYGPVIIQGADDNPNSPFTSKGHYVVGNKVSGDLIDIDDPRGPQYSGLYKMSEVAKGARNMWSFSDGRSSGGYGKGPVKATNKFGGFGSTMNLLSSGVQNMNTGGVSPRTVVETASQELGYLEKDTNSQLDDKTANAATGKGNYTKYNRDMKLCALNDYWCCSFVCWVFTQACGEDRQRAVKLLCGQLSASCNSLMSNFKSSGRFDKNPIVGDCVFFSGSRHSGANHIGIVVGVDGSNVYTIEGNTSAGAGVQDNGGGVYFKIHPIASCLGFGHPNYESWEENYGGIKSANNAATTVSKTNSFGSTSGITTSNRTVAGVAGGLSGFLSGAASAMMKPLYTLLGWNTEDSVLKSSASGSSYINTDGSKIVARTPNGDELGAYVKQFESGSRGPACVSNSSGDYGGMSFGTYQMASMRKNPVSKDNNIYKFWDRYGYSQKYPNAVPGHSEQFKNDWLKAVKEDPNFAKNEHEFYVTDFYTPGVKNISKYIEGDVNELSRGAQEAAWSTIVQHGPHDDTTKGKGAPQIFKSAGVKASMGNREFLEKLYDYKISSVDKRFASSSTSVRNGVRNRFIEEKAKLLPLAEVPPLGKSTANGGMVDATQAASNALSAANTIRTQVQGETVASQGGNGGYGGRPLIPRKSIQYKHLKGYEPSAPHKYTPITPTPKVYYGGFGESDKLIAERLDKIDTILQSIANSSSGTNSGVAKLYDKDFGSPTTNNNNFNSFNVGRQGSAPKKQTSFKDATGRDRSGYAAAKQLASGGLLGM